MLVGEVKWGWMDGRLVMDGLLMEVDVRGSARSYDLFALAVAAFLIFPLAPVHSEWVVADWSLVAPTYSRA